MKDAVSPAPGLGLDVGSEEPGQPCGRAGRRGSVDGNHQGFVQGEEVGIERSAFASRFVGVSKSVGQSPSERSGEILYLGGGGRRKRSEGEPTIRAGHEEPVGEGPGLVQGQYVHGDDVNCTLFEGTLDDPTVDGFGYVTADIVPVSGNWQDSDQPFCTFYNGSQVEQVRRIRSGRAC